jgi:hypothetical protein
MAISAFIPEYLDFRALKVNVSHYLFLYTLGLQDIYAINFEADDRPQSDRLGVSSVACLREFEDWVTSVS